MRTIWLDTIDSTQALARREIESGLAPAPPQPVAHIARVQAAGVGQRGRPWHSPDGGLWMTLSLPVDRPPAPRLGLEVGWIVLTHCRRVAAELGLSEPLRLKWPNDLMLGDRKLAGMLIESITVRAVQWVLIGVGLNLSVDARALPDQLRARVACLLPASGINFDRQAFAQQLALEIAALARGATEPVKTADLAANMWRLGQVADFTTPDGESLRGKIVALTEAGCLVLERDGSRVELPSATQIW